MSTRASQALVVEINRLCSAKMSHFTVVIRVTVGGFSTATFYSHCSRNSQVEVENFRGAVEKLASGVHASQAKAKGIPESVSH